MTEAAAALRAGLRRGTVVTVASPGVYSGKPRPAVVVQADRWLELYKGEWGGDLGRIYEAASL